MLSGIEKARRKSLFWKLSSVLIFTAVCLLGYALSGCATEHAVDTLDSLEDLETKGHTSEGRVALNDKEQAVIVAETPADVELESSLMANYNLRERLRRELFTLQTCREELASPARGGSGEVEAAPAAMIAAADQAAGELGLTESGELKVVRTSYLDERLKTEETATAKLLQLVDAAKKLVHQCELEARYAKEKTRA